MTENKSVEQVKMTPENLAKCIKQIGDSICDGCYTIHTGSCDIKDLTIAHLISKNDENEAEIERLKQVNSEVFTMVYGEGSEQIIKENQKH